jgi:hypothetical protein
MQLHSLRLRSAQVIPLQMHPELAEGELPFAIFENCPVARNSINNYLLPGVKSSADYY